MEPETKTIFLSAYNVVRGSEPRTTPAPYTRRQLLEEPEVKRYLEQGYELIGFKDDLTDEFTRTVSVTLMRK